MELDWLKDFLALAELGNFSRAADQRNVTQPAFSRRIRALEDWTGTPLFLRGAQGAALTAAGETLRPLARDLVRGLERARRETRRAGERQSASLCVAATHALSFTFFPGWIHRHVGLDTLGTLNLISDSMGACEQILLSGEVHFLLCHHHPDAPLGFDAERFESIAVGTDTLVPLSAPDANGGAAWPIPGTVKKPTRLLGYSPASGLGRILAAQGQLLRAPAGGETVFTSHLAATLQNMARGGQGAAWLPLSLVEEDLRQGRLVRAAGSGGTTKDASKAGRAAAGGTEAGANPYDIPIQIRLFRSPDCRNSASEQLWNALREAE